MSILAVSCIVYAARIGVYLRYLAISEVLDFDPMTMVWALLIVVILLSIAVGLMMGRGGSGK